MLVYEKELSELIYGQESKWVVIKKKSKTKWVDSK